MPWSEIISKVSFVYFTARNGAQRHRCFGVIVVCGTRMRGPPPAAYAVRTFLIRTTFQSVRAHLQKCVILKQSQADTNNNKKMRQNNKTKHWSWVVKCPQACVPRRLMCSMNQRTRRACANDRHEGSQHNTQRRKHKTQLIGIKIKYRSNERCSFRCIMIYTPLAPCHSANPSSTVVPTKTKRTDDQNTSSSSSSNRK